MPPFSQKNGYTPVTSVKPELRDVVSPVFRGFVQKSAQCWGVGRNDLQSLVWRIAKIDIGTEEKHLWASFHCALLDASWYQVYDLVEAVHGVLLKLDQFTLLTGSFGLEFERAVGFESDIKEHLAEEGVPWQLVDGQIILRGSEGFEDLVQTAFSELKANERPTAAGEIREALRALSGRPDPNFRGAVFHGMGALECVVRDIAEDPKVTLGEALKKYPALLPKPVDEAIAKLWGYASNEARHVEEGREPAYADAELIVGISASVATYLTRKQRPL